MEFLFQKGLFFDIYICVQLLQNKDSVHWHDRHQATSLLQTSSVKEADGSGYKEWLGRFIYLCDSVCLICDLNFLGFAWGISFGCP